MADLRAVCEQLANELQEYINYAPTGPCDEEQALVDEARAALAQPDPAPTDEELLQLAREWNSGHESIEFDFIGDYARAVLARWGNA
jgi:hypothetical protein